MDWLLAAVHVADRDCGMVGSVAVVVNIFIGPVQLLHSSHLSLYLHIACNVGMASRAGLDKPSTYAGKPTAKPFFRRQLMFICRGFVV